MCSVTTTERERDVRKRSDRQTSSDKKREWWKGVRAPTWVIHFIKILKLWFADSRYGSVASLACLPSHPPPDPDPIVLISADMARCHFSFLLLLLWSDHLTAVPHRLMERKKQNLKGQCIPLWMTKSILRSWLWVLWWMRGHKCDFPRHGSTRLFRDSTGSRTWYLVPFLYHLHWCSKQGELRLVTTDRGLS